MAAGRIWPLRLPHTPTCTESAMTVTLRALPLLAAVAVVVSLAFASPRGAERAFAEDCSPDATGTLLITIIDGSTGSPVSIGGTQVLIDPDPADFTLDQIVTDSTATDVSALADKDSSAGHIRYQDACSTEGSEEYEIETWAVPDHEDFEECDPAESVATTTLAADATENVEVEILCAGAVATATAEAEASVSAITITASPLAVGCNGTSVLEVTATNADGGTVAGVPVALSTDFGSLSSSADITTSNAGTAYAFFSGPSASGGTATITATSGSLSDTASVTVNCGGTGSASATVPPPPTLGPNPGGGGIITPPNTGGAESGEGGGTSALVLTGLAAAIFGLAVLAAWRLRFS